MLPNAIQIWHWAAAAAQDRAACIRVQTHAGITTVCNESPDLDTFDGSIIVQADARRTSSGAANDLLHITLQSSACSTKHKQPHFTLPARGQLFCRCRPFQLLVSDTPAILAATI